MSNTEIRGGEAGGTVSLQEALQDKEHSVLLVVDVQNDFCHEDGVCAQAGGYPVAKTHRAVGQVKTLLEHARAAGLPVMHARLRVDWEKENQNWLDRLLRLRQPSLCSPESFGESAYTGAEEMPGEPVIYKRRFSAFWGTGLADQLRKQGVKRVIVCGVATNICVQASATDAFMDGFQVFLVSDASAAYSDEGHEAALTLIDLAYGDAVSTDEVVGALSDAEPATAAS